MLQLRCVKILFIHQTNFKFPYLWSKPWYKCWYLNVRKNYFPLVNSFFKAYFPNDQTELQKMKYIHELLNWFKGNLYILLSYLTLGVFKTSKLIDEVIFQSFNIFFGVAITTCKWYFFSFNSVIIKWINVILQASLNINLYSRIQLLLFRFIELKRKMHCDFYLFIHSFI